MNINWKHLILGVVLNILVIIACLMIYDAYRVEPNMPAPIIYNNAESLENADIIDEIIDEDSLDLGVLEDLEQELIDLESR